MFRRFTAAAVLGAAITAGGLTAPATAQAACDSYLPGPHAVCAGDTWQPSGRGAVLQPIRNISVKVGWGIF
jgi:hypothetical protein